MRLGYGIRVNLKPIVHGHMVAAAGALRIMESPGAVKRKWQ